MYNNARNRVWSVAGQSQEFTVGVGVHEGSALSPLLFNAVMDLVTNDVQAALPWKLLCSDDIVLVAGNAEDMQITLWDWVNSLENARLRVSRTKTKHLICHFSGNQVNSSDRVYYPDGTMVQTVKQ